MQLRGFGMVQTEDKSVNFEMQTYKIDKLGPTTPIFLGQYIYCMFDPRIRKKHPS